jgi:enoyl-CoA hydratase/carnithine racemase
VPGGRLLVEHLDGVTTLTLARPEVHNAIDAETVGMLARAIHAFARDDQVRVLVVTGRGPRLSVRAPT